MSPPSIVLVLRTEDLLNDQDPIEVLWDDWSATATPEALDAVSALDDGESTEIDGVSYLLLREED